MSDLLERNLTGLKGAQLIDEIYLLREEIERLEDKLRHSDRKEIEACYRAMGTKDARVAELEDALRLVQDELSGGAWLAVDLALTGSGGN